MEKGDKHPGTIIGVRVAIELVKIALKHTCLNCYANTSRDVKSNYLTCPNGCPSGSFYKQGAEGDQWRVVDALRLYYLLKLGLEYDECTKPRFVYRNYGANKASLTCKKCNILFVIVKKF